MTNEDEPLGGRLAFDLEERMAKFGEVVIAFAKRVRHDRITDQLVGQLVRAGTSVGANYCEADEADTNKEFRYRISIAKRESKETRFQLRMIVAAEPELAEPARPIWQESKELPRIFASILRRDAGK